MKKLFYLLAMVLMMAPLRIFADDKNTDGAEAFAHSVYVLRLDDEVDNKMAKVTRRACDEALQNGYTLLLVHINTFGGAVDAADSIRTALLHMPIPTVAYVDHNAASAGALITLACDTVYMAPGASMGASTVVNQSGEPMPEKYQSYMKSIMRSTAESHGKYWSEADSAWHWRRDPAIAESMVMPDKATSFTADEAVQAGYAEGIANSLPEVIAIVAPDHRKVAHFHATATDHILGFLANAAIRAVLIMLIIGGIYMEMQSPGLGIAGGVAFVAAILYFLPMMVEGTMAPWVIILFIIGVLLLALEIFVIPGFGVAGITGIIAVLASLVGGMLNSTSMSGSYAVDVVQAVIITAAGIIMSIAAVWFLTSKYGPKSVRRVAELQTELHNKEGYIGVDTSVSEFVGHRAIAATDLRPSGKIMIDDTEYDAVSLSGFIEAHTEVKVVKFENAQLYVKPIHHSY